MIKRLKHANLPGERSSGVSLAPSTSVRQRFALVALLGTLAVLQICDVWAKLPAHANRFDFSIYYLSATAEREGLDPYDVDFRPLGHKLGLEVGQIHHATDPPAFLLLIEPMASLSESTAFEVWTAINALLLGLAFMFLWKKPFEYSWYPILVLLCLTLIYPPVTVHFLSGQSKIPILLLLAAMIRLMEQGRDWAAGLCLALATLLRVFPFLLIGYLAIQRRWMVLAWTLAGIAIGTAGMVPAFGIHNSFSFYRGMRLLTDANWLSEWGDISLRAGVSRLVWFCAGSRTGSIVEGVRIFSVYATDAALLIATIIATFRLPPREDPDWRSFTMWVVASILLSPIAWVHYMVLFVILFTQICYAAGQSRVSKRAQYTAIASYLVIMQTPTISIISLLVQAKFGSAWGHITADTMAEGWFLSVILGYLAAYWFVVDSWEAADIAARPWCDSAT